MKYLLLVGLLITCEQSRLGAQRFDGVTRFAVYDKRFPDSHADTMTQLSKGSNLRWNNLIDDDSVRFVLIPERKEYIEMPGSERGFSDLLLLPKNGHVSNSNLVDTVAGIPCSVWHYEGTHGDGSLEDDDICIAKGAGLMLNRQGGHTGLFFAAGGYTFREVLTLDMGILRSTENGEVKFVVLSATPGSVPDSIFVPPKKYKRFKRSVPTSIK